MFGFLIYANIPFQGGGLLIFGLFHDHYENHMIALRIGIEFCTVASFGLELGRRFVLVCLQGFDFWRSSWSYASHNSHLWILRLTDLHV